MGTSRLRSRPLPAQLWIALLSAVGTATLVSAVPNLSKATAHQWGVVGALLLSGLAAGEAGRLVEGRRRHDAGRLSKCLTAFPFAAALCCPAGFAALIVIPLYAHTRWRGLKVPMWKWVGSASILIVAAELVRLCRDLPGARSELAETLPTGPLALLSLGAAIALMIATEAALFAVCANLNDEADEVDLRAALRSRAFYSGEVMACAIGAVSAGLANDSAWAVIAVLPIWVTVQRAAVQPALRQRADIDGRTGLLTFNAWSELATDRLAEKRTLKGAAIVLLDLDHFKRVNDQRGHLEGDALLARAAARMRNEVRPHDLLGRFGGEEFVLLALDVTEAEAALIAERVRRAAGTPPELAALGRFVISASAGVSWSADVTGLDIQLAKADAALYAAKAAGRDTLRVSVPIQRMSATDSIADLVGS